MADGPDLVRLDDPIHRKRLALLGRQRAELSASIPMLGLRAGLVTVLDERIAAFSRTARDRLRSVDPSFRRQWLQLFVDEVVGGRCEIVIGGRNDTLLNGVTGRPDCFGPTVPSFDQAGRASQNKTTNSYCIEIAL